MSGCWQSKISNYCVEKLANSLLLPAFPALYSNILILPAFHPELIRGSLKIKRVENIERAFQALYGFHVEPLRQVIANTQGIFRREYADPITHHEIA